MAIKLTSSRVVAGRIIPVWNTERKAFSNAKKHYLAVWVEDACGGNERCLLFTDKELERAEHRAQQNPEDLTKKSWWTNALD
jgi:hypothetical protein